MKKIAILAMIAVLALTAVGFGFAKWSSVVDVDVTVNTGSVLIGIRDVGTNDDGTNVGVEDHLVGVGALFPGQLGGDPQWTAEFGGAGLNSEWKDVAKKESVNNGEPVGKIGDTNYYRSVTETITNGYPYYGPTSVFEIANLGTIPVKIETLAWTWAEGSVINDNYYETVKWSISYPGLAAELTGQGTASLLENLKSIQLHADQVLTLSMQEGIRQTSKNDGTITPQNASGKATLNVVASQWNEVQ